MIEKITKLLTGNVVHVDSLIGAIESILLALVSRIASYGASVPNCIMVERSIEQIFNVSFGLALAIAISLELISHALVHNWQEQKAWNETKRKTDIGANENLALALVLGFFVLDVAMVGVLAISTYQTTEDWRIFISLSYPLIGAFTAVCTNQRANLFRIKTTIEHEKEEKRQARKAAKPVQSVSSLKRTPMSKKDKRIEQLLNIYELDSLTPITDIARQLGASRTTVYSYIDELEEQGKIKKNGQGVEILTRG